MPFVSDLHNTQATEMVFDSRKISFPQKAIFFAIKGIHHNGHLFVEELYKKGVREFVVENAGITPELSNLWENLLDARFWLVENSIAAMQFLATIHRQKYNIPILAITGSNGKTIVKEWLAQLLSENFVIAKSPKSYNSQIGVPVSVYQLNQQHSLGIFEVGISRKNEMTNLEKIVAPTLGIITNIGTAHGEGFENISEKIREKLQLFLHAKVLFVCQEHTAILEEVTNFLLPQNTNLHIVTWQKQTIESTFEFPFSDTASLENIGHCITVMQYLGISNSQIQERLHHIRAVSMRLELKEGTNGCYLIDDTYNNDLAGLTLALDFLNQQQQRPHKALVLSDLLETGNNETELYQQLAYLLKSKGINQLIGIGETLVRHQNLFLPPAKFFRTTEEFLKNLRLSDFWQSIILIKGARLFAFERIVQVLQQKTHRTYLEINLDALSDNFNYFRKKVGQHTKIMAMVKAFAYGSGSIEVANLLQSHRVDYLAVAYADEGVSLRENGIKTPIMVMNPSQTSFEQLLKYQLEPEIYSLLVLQQWLLFIAQKQQNKPVANEDVLFPPVHLKLDTGMHRLGFEPKDIISLLSILEKTTVLRIASVFTHLAATDDPSLDYFTQEQLSIFRKMANSIEQVLGYAPLRHSLNSAGIARFPTTKQDMVRLGIGLYGVAATPNDQIHLRTVGTLRTVISQIKHVLPQQTVGYGRKGIALHPIQIATVALGYADGYDRRFGNGIGKVNVNGTLCPVIGNVCMDMTMIDISHATANEGDDVVVFGDNPSIEQAAQSIGTIPYEILTNISERVKRVFFKETN